MNLPFVSCICPTFGRTKLLEEAIESFLKQDYEGRCELVVCNDLPGQHIWFQHPRVKIRNLAERCKSLGDKRNITVSMAGGDLLMTWGDDDIHLPSRISRMVHWMKLNNLDFALEGNHYCWNSNRLIENDFSTGGAHTIARNLYWDVGGIPSISSGEDIAFNDLVQKHLALEKLPSCNLPPQFIYRWQSDREHISALAQRSSPAECYDKMLDSALWNLQSGREPSGNVFLEPKFSRDWNSLIAQKKQTLSIIMGSYEDYHGTYFTIQSLRLHHSLKDAEFIVLDNNPGDEHSKALNHFAKSGNNIKIIPVSDRKSSFVKYDGFMHATGDIILGLDCHVLLANGFIDHLLEYWHQNPDSKDMLTGPLLYDDLHHVSTHMDPKWRGEDFGTWGTNQEGMKYNQPFEIQMQGMACYSMLRKNWHGISKEFREFGAEEWYIAEKVRQWGGKVMCHPLLKWVHRFGGPKRNFPISQSSKIINYYRGWLELYGDENHPMIKTMTDHWEPLVGPDRLKTLIEKAKLPAL